LLTLEEKEKELSTAADALSHVSGRLHAADLEASAARAACTEACVAISSAASCPVTPRFLNTAGPSAQLPRIPTCVPGQQLSSALGRPTITPQQGDRHVAGSLRSEADRDCGIGNVGPQSQPRQSPRGVDTTDRPTSSRKNLPQSHIGDDAREDGRNHPMEGMGGSRQALPVGDSACTEDGAPYDVDDRCSEAISSLDGAGPASDGRASPLQLRRTYSTGGPAQGVDDVVGLASPRGYEGFHVQDNQEFRVDDAAHAVSLMERRTVSDAMPMDLADPSAIKLSKRGSTYEAILKEADSPLDVRSPSADKSPIATRRMSRPPITPPSNAAVAAIAAYRGRRSTLLGRPSIVRKDAQDHVAMKLDLHSVQARNSTMIRSKQAEAQKPRNSQAENSKKRIRTSSFALPVRNDAAWSS
jgi:hypothetical protein